ncbi:MULTISPECIES: hypothetical protein [Aneurinibacillus]|uniref:Uncharacterized protein n=1 Tax=Aneurinibacillus thermoaerophilus TaxID=143495 RepID=A0ABX8YCB5_ANETH|nr:MULTISPECIES: hypothetical protein [Aneurinibacillus]AMA74326.1 hypothetical protein ACH33_16925 [Aneurinibacillus sp. XH2]MED0681440.1 hypothetical protein [Aneurinibacillus thermoaerophilus]MED0737830.1 hypothetical protein [Aneurinibacillus thermoaerophilus]QYY43091.1 hypothetical protein K3F53_01905 [Aneurinibacillus thermoaerophilus]
MSWNMRMQEVLERTADYDMSLMDAEQNEAYQHRLELNRIKLEMQEAKKEADEFLKLAEAYKAAGEEKGYLAAWSYHKLNLRRYHDLSLYYTKKAAECGNTQTA